MEKTVKDHLARVFENLSARSYKKFRCKLEDEGKSGKVPITKREVDLADDESKLADLLLEVLGDADAVKKTVEILKFIQCNDTASKLQAEYPETHQAQRASEGKNANSPAPGKLQSEDKRGFFKEHSVSLIQNVRTVEPILDVLIEKDFPSEIVANARAEATTRRQMRVILDGTTTKARAEILFNALQANEGDLVDELMS